MHDDVVDVHRRPADPFVSVVTVCFNSERHIRRAAQSVLGQSYPSVEYVVVDGASTDRTLEILAEFQTALGDRMKLVSEPDDGIYDAMNKGIGMATGDFIVMLNSDDWLEPDAVGNVVRGSAQNPDAGAFYGDVRIAGQDGESKYVQESLAIDPDRPIPVDIPMCHQTLFVRKTVYEALGGYDTRFRILADYEFVLRCIRQGVRFVRLPIVLANFTLGGVCNTDIRRSNAEREQIRVMYGANPIVERARRMRHGINLWLYGCLEAIGAAHLLGGRRRP